MGTAAGRCGMLAAEDEDYHQPRTLAAPAPSPARLPPRRLPPPNALRLRRKVKVAELTGARSVAAWFSPGAPFGRGVVVLVGLQSLQVAPGVTHFGLQDGKSFPDVLQGHPNLVCKVVGG